MGLVGPMKAYPCITNYIQTIIETVDAWRINHLLIKTLPTSNHARWLHLTPYKPTQSLLFTASSG